MTATVFITNITYSKQNLPIFLLFHFFPFFFHYFLLFPAFNVLLISISTRKTQNQRSIATIGFFRSTLVSWKRKKKQYVLFWKISHDMRDHVRQLSTTAAFFYFEMKFDYWHVQELILENWLDRIWIVCCNSRNTVVSMVKDLMNIILFKSFFF